MRDVYTAPAHLGLVVCSGHGMGAQGFEVTEFESRDVSRLEDDLWSASGFERLLPA